jgi:outer membrane protein
MTERDGSRRICRQASGRWWCAALALHLMLVGRLGAQQAAPRPLTLSDVVRTVLDSAIDLRGAQQQLNASEAGRAIAGAPYEPQVATFAANATDRQLTEGSGSTPPSSILSTSTTYGVTVDRMFRSGLIISPSIGVTRQASSTASLPPPNRASVNLGLTMPLLRGFGNSPARAGEVAAASDMQASELDLQHTAARTVLTAVSAYWDYLGAYRRLEVQQLAERRADELVTETRALVSADERSPSELLSLNANASLKRIPRIAAEQSVLEARQRLGIALGLPAEAIWRLGAPATDFPRGDALTAPSAAGGAALASRAEQLRADVAAARARFSSAKATREGLSRESKPRLDVVLGVGYTGAERGSAFRQYYSSIFQGVAGLNSSVQINYQPSIGSEAVRGLIDQAQAAMDRSSLTVADLTRTAVTATHVAAEGLRSARQQLEIAEEAVALTQKSVESEMTKFRLGMSTRFDVIQAEDALTGALLGHIGAQVLASQALVRVRFESGALLHVGEGRAMQIDVPGLLAAGPAEW